MGNSFEQALKRCDFRGGACAALFVPMGAFPRLIGIMGRAVNQESEGF